MVAKVPTANDPSLRMNPDAVKPMEQPEPRPQLKRSGESSQQRIDPSYSVSLSESGQAKANEPLPVVRSQEEARRQLDLIRTASQKAPATLTNSQNPNAKSAIDLLA